MSVLSVAPTANASGNGCRRSHRPAPGPLLPLLKMGKMPADRSARKSFRNVVMLPLSFPHELAQDIGSLRGIASRRQNPLEPGMNPGIISYPVCIQNARSNPSRARRSANAPCRQWYPWCACHDRCHPCG